MWILGDFGNWIKRFFVEKREVYKYKQLPTKSKLFLKILNFLMNHFDFLCLQIDRTVPFFCKERVWNCGFWRLPSNTYSSILHTFILREKNRAPNISKQQRPTCSNEMQTTFWTHADPFPKRKHLEIPASLKSTSINQRKYRHPLSWEHNLGKYRQMILQISTQVLRKCRQIVLKTWGICLSDKINLANCRLNEC